MKPRDYCSNNAVFSYVSTLFVFLTITPPSDILAQNCGHNYRSTIVLTKQNPKATGYDSYIAPGNGYQCYTVYNLDCSAFGEGGKIIIKIQNGKDSVAGSFDLFPGAFALPRVGRPVGTLKGAYDVSSGAKAEFEYKFDSPITFQFGATGNWFSKEGLSNTYTFDITVDFEHDYEHERLGTIILTPASPGGSGKGTLIAPGYGKQAYKLFAIDASSFAGGGRLVIKVKLLGDGCSASFDLFPAGIEIPKKGRPKGTLVGSYDQGAGAILEYQFTSGMVFLFGATGSWGSKAGSTRGFEFTAEVITDKRP